MRVDLIHHTPLSVAIMAIRNCYKSEGLSDTEELITDKLGKKDIQLLDKILDSRHSSTVEHINYTFFIKGLTRGVLQELVRHRIASYSVKSTRYTLVKELREEAPFTLDKDSDYTIKRLSKFIDTDCDYDMLEARVKQLEILRKYIVAHDIKKSDLVKALVPDSLLTDVVLTMNARSLANFFNLRLSSRAWEPIRFLAATMYSLLPAEHTILFKTREQGTL